jgi:hypothetical protein
MPKRVTSRSPPFAAETPPFPRVPGPREPRCQRHRASRLPPARRLAFMNAGLAGAGSPGESVERSPKRAGGCQWGAERSPVGNPDVGAVDSNSGTLRGWPSHSATGRSRRRPRAGHGNCSWMSIFGWARGRAGGPAFWTCPFHLVDPGTLGPAAALEIRGTPSVDHLGSAPSRSGFRRTEAHAPTGDVIVAGTALRQELYAASRP